MKKIISLSFFLLTWTLAWAQTPVFSDQDTYQITQPSGAKTLFSVAEPGTYRLETLGNLKMEFSVAEKMPTGNWQTLATSRNLKGELDSGVEVSLKKGTSYLFIALLAPDANLPLTFTVKKSQFAGLRNQVKDNLVLALPENLPLKERLVWTSDLSIHRIKAAWSKGGELFAALVTSDSLQVWSLTQRSPLGLPLAQASQVENFDLAVGPTGPLVVWQEGDKKNLKIRQWNGNGWIDQSFPTASGPGVWVNLPQGPALLFRLPGGTVDLALWTPSGWKKASGEPWGPSSGPAADSGPTGAVFHGRPVISFVSGTPDEAGNQVFTLEKGRFWTSAETPEVRGALGQILAPGTEVLFSAVQTQNKGWSLFQWREETGWQVANLPADLKTSADLGFCADGGNLWVSELSPQGLRLFQYDGQQWRAPLPLQALSDHLPTASGFLDSPGEGKAHHLFLVEAQPQGATVKVYDLP